jgi:nickel-dependent lactate racemase
MNTINIRYGKEYINIPFNRDIDIYKPQYRSNSFSTWEIVSQAINQPLGKTSLVSDIKLNWNKNGKIVIVITDITRPLPYHSFMPQLLSIIEKLGIEKYKIQFLIATGMHRPSTRKEKISLLGEKIVNQYKIIDHKAEDKASLVQLPGKSKEGAEIILNKHYVEAGYRIVISLVEPHFMAGFSGGRKMICPGLSSFNTIRRFHGFEMLSNQNARQANLENNPCHEETLSVARQVPPDFAINIVMDNNRNITETYTGELFKSWQEAVNSVKKAACKQVTKKADIVITGCGGHPLDTTFYQCVKGFVACLPALKEHGKIICMGSCSEGIGGKEYENLMKSFNGNWQKFLTNHKNPNCFVKDQWQYQMHIRTLMKTSMENLYFLTDGLPQSELDMLSVHGISTDKNKIALAIEKIIERSDADKIAVFPEGPYCVPIDI